jgi:flagellar motor switch protein FliM
MSLSASPADLRAHILERLTGATGEPDHLIAAARGFAERALPSILEKINGDLCFPLEVEIAEIALDRLAAARPEEGSFDAMVVLASSASPDAVILTIDADAIALFLTATLGGDADLPVVPITRPLSPTEIDLGGMLCERIANAVNGSGERGLGLRFPLREPLTGAEARKLKLRDGPSVRIVLRLVAPAGCGAVTLSMPQRLFLKPRGEGGAASEHDLAARKAWGSRFNEEVMRARVALSATIPLGRMTLGELAELAVGQVIPLPHTAPSETRLNARGKTVFLCEFGKLGDNFTVRVKQPYDAGKAFMEGLTSK